MEARERQVAENEVRFRALNERLQQAQPSWQGLDGALALVCECGDVECTTPLELTPQEYEAVRAVETDFLVAPGHVHPELEDVIVDRGDWLIVRKRGEAALLAAETDPRA